MIDSFLQQTSYFALAFSFAVYYAALSLQKRCRVAALKPLLNPLLITVLLTIALLLATNTSYETFQAGASHLSYLLTPTTVCLAVPLYEKIGYLKKMPVAILVGILSGVLASALSILGMSLLFGLTSQQYITLLPKSVTMAIGMDLSSELGGLSSITVAAITVTGLFGNLVASYVFKLFRITHPVAKGLACGTASHAMGTARAAELGKTEEAMSGLAIAVAGLMTVLAATLFSYIPV
ncbi:MAG: LrgB family protein [Clostridiales bacterium]|nr:LrgB family protein [Clostridiales bacterium]